jgi:hypothetical protein
MTESVSITVERRFNGPSLSGNGGYVAGVLARHVGAPVVETLLRAPIPLDTPMTFATEDGGWRRLRHGDRLIAESRAIADFADAPPPPAPWDAVEGTAREGGCGPESDFYTCLVCGRGREPGDGLRVWGAGVEPGRSLSLYRAHAAHAEADGRIAPEFLWGALDCPGAWAAQDPDDWRPALTGRMAGRVIDRPFAGERCQVVGWRVGVEGRKLFSGTALYGEDGRLCAEARCTWIALKIDA